MSKFIAIDLGAESGRVMVGVLDGRLRLEEAYRFPNGPVEVLGNLYWNPLGLFKEILAGLRTIGEQYGRDFASVGVDTWGVDYALLDRAGELIGTPYCYRDGRTEGMMEAVLERISRQALFEQTGGIQFLTFNTLFQLYSMVQEESPQLSIADTFLMMPDLFNYWLTGHKAAEFTNATTTQFYNSLEKEWARDVLETLALPTHIFPDVVLPGSQVGRLREGLNVGLGRLPVVAPATHDTASAVVAVPAEGHDFAWISSGTWSLVGAMAEQAIVSAEALQYNISSYGGAGGSCLPWKNVMGLWLVQECRRIWAREGQEYTYEEIIAMAAQAQPFKAVIDPDDAGFLAPEHMPQQIGAYCRETGQSAPETKGEVLRTALESLALKYRWVVEKLGLLLERDFTALHIVGGGSQNDLLCQFAADASGLPVVAGPVEATAIGNVAVQAVGTGHLGSLEEARALVRRSFEVTTYEPGHSGPWDEAYETFIQLL